MYTTEEISKQAMYMSLLFHQTLGPITGLMLAAKTDGIKKQSMNIKEIVSVMNTPTESSISLFFDSKTTTPIIL